MRNLKVRLLLAAVMFVLALGVGMLPTVDATEFQTDFETEIEGGGDWAVVCCGGSCSPDPHCYGNGNYSCCR